MSKLLRLNQTTKRFILFKLVPICLGLAVCWTLAAVAWHYFSAAKPNSTRVAVTVTPADRSKTSAFSVDVDVSHAVDLVMLDDPGVYFTAELEAGTPEVTLSDLKRHGFDEFAAVRKQCRRWMNEQGYSYNRESQRWWHHRDPSKLIEQTELFTIPPTPEHLLTANVEIDWVDDDAEESDVSAEPTPASSNWEDGRPVDGWRVTLARQSIASARLAAIRLALFCFLPPSLITVVVTYKSLTQRSQGLVRDGIELLVDQAQPLTMLAVMALAGPYLAFLLEAFGLPIPVFIIGCVVLLLGSFAQTDTGGSLLSEIPGVKPTVLGTRRLLAFVAWSGLVLLALYIIYSVWTGKQQ